VLSLLALGSSACWGTSDFFAGLFSRRRSPVVVVGWTQSLAFLVISAVVLTQLGNVPWTGWPLWAVAAGISGVGGLLCFYTALSTGTMGVVAPIAALGVAIPVLLGVATGDDPSPWTWVGILVAVVGVTFASGPSSAERSRRARWRWRGWRRWGSAWRCSASTVVPASPP
jgi:drug/metabolite transporter (DMT)-like permease